MSRQTSDPAPRDPFDVATGARMRLLRLLRGVTLVELAGRIGVSFQQVQKYEHGANRMTAPVVARVAEILGVSLAELLGDTPGARALSTPTLVLLAEAGALELLRAYGRVSDRQVRERLATFAAAVTSTPDADAAS